MARQIYRLTTTAVRHMGDGMHADGGGLYLSAKGGARRWVFIFRASGRRREMGLGSVATTSLAKAREAAAAARAVVAAGGDPIEAKHAAERATPLTTIPTFGEFAESYIKSVESGWKNEVHRAQWRQSLRDHAKLLSAMPVDQIGTDDILAVLRPIWATKPETAGRLRGRIEKLLDAAKAQGLRPRDSMNPATWRSHLALLLPRRSKLTRGHHPALPYAEIAAFWSALGDRPALSARLVEFIVLTAARSGEALGATWGEIDMAARLWRVPANRMKASVAHHVPLSDSALAVLELVRPIDPKPDDLLFAVGGAPRSNMSATMLLRRMGYGHVTVHGFRSTFRDWAGDVTEYPRELIEEALAHTIANATERAYRRGRAIERRRQLMADWATFVTGGAVDARAVAA